MAETFVLLLPFIVVGAFLPTWTSHIILFLGTERPISTSVAYVLGNVTFRMILGLFVLFVADATMPTTRVNTLVLPTGLAALIAGSLIAMGGYLIARHPKTEMIESTDQMPRWLKRFRRLSPGLTFAWGFVNVAMPGMQWVYFLGGLAVIAAARLEPLDQVVLLAIYVLLLQVMLVAPILIYAWRRERAERAFARIEAWLTKNASRVIGFLLVGMGILFAIAGFDGGKFPG